MADIKKLRQRCFFDIAIGTTNVGRMVFELFNDVCPKTCDNFRSLCTGEKGLGKTTGKGLHYKNVLFHRVVKDFIIQSGDFSMGNGRGGESIFGGTFNDENFEIKHDKPFLLSMANRGKNTNGSQFFITLRPTPHLDGVHVVFGHLLTGQEVINEIQKIETSKDDKPVTDITIANCGELIPQIKPKAKKKKHRKEKLSKSEGELTSDDEDRSGNRKSKKKKEKSHKKHKNEDKTEIKDENAKEIEDLSVECSVRPDEVPDIPKNNFLTRIPLDFEENERERNSRFNDNRHNQSSSRRTFKGRGRIRYRTPSPSHHYRSGSETPPHWRNAMSKLVSLKQISDKKQRRTDRDSDRNRFERRGGFRQSREFDRNFNRNFDFRDKYRKEGSDYENISDRRTERKRVFTEEPQKRSVSPKQVSNHRKDKTESNGESYVNSTQEIERHFIKSEVKVNESSKRVKRSSPEVSRHKSPVELKDIPLPDTDHNRNGSESESKREDRHKRSGSREKSSHKKLSSRH